MIVSWAGTTATGYGGCENGSLLRSKSNETSGKCFKQAGGMMKFAF